MDNLPSSGNVGLDISIALITGGAVTTWLTLLLDTLAKKRAEQIDITKQKIEKISKSEIYYMHISNYYTAISSIIYSYLENKKWKTTRL